MRSSLLFFGLSSLVAAAACGASTTPGAARVLVGDDGGSGDDGGYPDVVTTTPGCLAGQAQCNGVCKNVASDNNNCGTCGNVCASGTRCFMGSCVMRVGRDAGPEGGVDSGAGILPPDPGGPPASGASAAFALSRLYYGDSDRSGNLSANAWASYGLNLDGQTTTAGSTDVCTLAAGASKAVQVDGDNGIDNSFGANIVPILATLTSSFSAIGNKVLYGGDATPLLLIESLGSGADYSPLYPTYYRSTSATQNPQWNGMDIRDVDLASTGGSPSQPNVAFSRAYMNARTFVAFPAQSGLPGLFDLHLGNVGQNAALPLYGLTLAAAIDPTNASATQGVVAGVVLVNDMLAWFQQQAGGLSMSLCNASALMSIDAQLAQAADIVWNGVATNGAGQACNAISFGMGFDATAVRLGTGVNVAIAQPICP